MILPIPCPHSLRTLSLTVPRAVPYLFLATQSYSPSWFSETPKGAN